MKLYVYDSCPFCTRVRTFIGLKNIDCDIAYLQAGQFPEHLEGRIAEKVVPILEIENDVDNHSELMQESLEIIEFLDKSYGAPLIRDYNVSDEINQRLFKISKSSSMLCYPRMPSLELPELESKEAKAFFKLSREERMGCSFTEALLNTDRVAAGIVEQLTILNSKLMLDDLLVNNRGVNLDDIATFSEMRNLSMVYELQLPELMKTFVEYISKQSGMPLFNPICKLGQTRGGGDG